MGLLRYVKLRYGLSFLKVVFLKARWGRRIRVNPLSVYIDPSVDIRVTGGGEISFEGGGRRIYISRGCVVNASGGSIRIGSGVFLNQNCMIVSHASVVIGNDAMFGPGVCVFDSDHAAEKLGVPFCLQGYVSNPVRIDRNVWVGANSVVVKGASIGCDVIIGANSVVHGTVTSGCVYAGIPARRIRILPWS